MRLLYEFSYINLEKTFFTVVPSWRYFSTTVTATAFIISDINENKGKSEGSGLVCLADAATSYSSVQVWYLCQSTLWQKKYPKLQQKRQIFQLISNIYFVSFKVIPNR